MYYNNFFVFMLFFNTLISADRLINEATPVFMPSVNAEVDLAKVFSMLLIAGIILR